MVTAGLFLGLLVVAGGRDRRELLDRADIETRESNYAAALAVVEDGLSSDPGDRDLRLRRGVLLSMLGRTGEAERNFRDLLVEREEARVRYNLALLRMRQGRDEEALSELATVLSDTPWYPEASYHVGRILETRGETNLALAAYVRELNHNPACAKAHQRYFALAGRKPPRGWSPRLVGLLSVLGAGGVAMLVAIVRRERRA
jgi:tetratricopeptide (TPR) repeat protein